MSPVIYNLLLNFFHNNPDVYTQTAKRRYQQKRCWCRFSSDARIISTRIWSDETRGENIILYMLTKRSFTNCANLDESIYAALVSRCFGAVICCQMNSRTHFSSPTLRRSPPHLLSSWSQAHDRTGSTAGLTLHAYAKKHKLTFYLLPWAELYCHFFYWCCI